MKLRLAQMKGHHLVKFSVQGSNRPLFACSQCGSYVVEQVRGLLSVCPNSKASKHNNKWKRLFIAHKHPRCNLFVQRIGKLVFPAMWSSDIYNLGALFPNEGAAGGVRQVVRVCDSVSGQSVLGHDKQHPRAGLDVSQASIVSESD